MDYKKFGETYYIRVDKGEEVIAAIIDVCEREGVLSACYSGIGGCSEAEIQTFIPEKGEFETRKVSGMLELASMNGNVIMDENGERAHHTHAVFAYKKGDEHLMCGGHLKSTTVLYTAEIELRPVRDGKISKKFNAETGTGFWDF